MGSLEVVQKLLHALIDRLLLGDLSTGLLTSVAASAGSASNFPQGRAMNRLSSAHAVPSPPEAR